ncbi:MAG: hypothetical protein FWD75_06760 [Propionibacteriaceae bacterium]|nr:hypothetical protein [Propionibacteriaceae bacterium]
MGWSIVSVAVDVNVLVRCSVANDVRQAAIAHQGRWLGAEEFVTFDRQAASILPQVGVRARYLGEQG